MIAYVAPLTLEDALASLAQHPNARPLAGGHGLLLEPRRVSMSNTLLVDLRKVPGLTGLRPTDSGVEIGAMCTLAMLAADAALRAHYPALNEALIQVGDPQLRNRATIGGSLIENDPEGDLPALMLALEAQFLLLGPQGTRALSALAFFRGPFETALAPGELLTAVGLPTPPASSGTAYVKFVHPASLYAICGVAASLNLQGDGLIAEARVALAGAAEFTTRLAPVEAALRGKPANAESFAAAAALAAEGVTMRGDHYASGEYRAHLAHVLSRQALARAAARARSA